MRVAPELEVDHEHLGRAEGRDEHPPGDLAGRRQLVQRAHDLDEEDDRGGDEQHRQKKDAVSPPSRSGVPRVVSGRAGIDLAGHVRMLRDVRGTRTHRASPVAKR